MRYPRPLTALALGALFAPAAGAQDLDALAAKRDAKLESAFLKALPWTTDYDVARARARESKRPIFAYFTRSYAP